MKFTNESKIGLSMAVFLVHDDYDYDPRKNAVSTTSVLKPPRQTILSQRVQNKTTVMDIKALIASSLGTAVHDGVEGAWLNGNYKKAMRKLGFPQETIDRIVVNHGYIDDPVSGKRIKDPKAGPLPKNAIPVYMEIRNERELDGITITGKFDFVGNGELEDHKTTGVYSFISGSNTEKFRLQGSIYRWLNQDIITSDRMIINYTFTDWNNLRYTIEKNQGYPPHRVMSVPLTLLPIDETEKYLKGRIATLKKYIDKPEQDLPQCTPEELWQDKTVYKYYKDPSSKTRSTKNFDNFAEAQLRLVKDGSVGVIDIVKGKAKACLYCAGAPMCSQAKQLVLDGLLDMEL